MALGKRSIGESLPCLGRQGGELRELVERYAYLTSGNELQRPQRGLHVGDVGLQVIEGVCNARLELGWFLPRRARCCDFVEGSHDCGPGVCSFLRIEEVVGL